MIKRRFFLSGALSAVAIGCQQTKTARAAKQTTGRARLSGRPMTVLHVPRFGIVGPMGYACHAFADCYSGG